MFIGRHRYTNIPQKDKNNAFSQKICLIICIIEKKAVLLHRELNEGTRKGLLALVK